MKYSKLPVTHAIVVGVGAYANGTLNPLHAPVDDALRFTRWLLDCGVPAANIHLCLSRTELNTEPVPPGVVERPATRDVIHAAIHGLAKKPGELLWFFWGGHGLVEKDRSMRLLYADATAQNQLNLDVTALMSFLRTTFFPTAYWKRQIFLVDACRNFDWRYKGDFAIPAETFPEGDEVPGREQFATFGARPGESAYEEYGETRAGVMSRLMLPLLQSAPLFPWPPDMEKITRELVEQFIALRAAGQAHQTPAFLWSRDWGTNDTTFANINVASAPVLPDPRAPRILTLDEKDVLVEALVACPSMAQRDSLEEIRLQLRPAIAHMVSNSPKLRWQIINLLEACLVHPGGVGELLGQIRFRDGKQPSVLALERLVRELLPGELPPPKL